MQVCRFGDLFLGQLLFQSNAPDIRCKKHLRRTRFELLSSHAVKLLALGHRTPHTLSLLIAFTHDKHFEFIAVKPVKEVPAAVYIGDCALGRGVFAARPFLAGEVILAFSGPRIGLAEALAKGDVEFNVLQIGDAEYQDIETPGVLANHSCEPNAGIKDDVSLIALRPLAVGEEIRWDYSTSMWESHEAIKMLCRCGSSGCRGVVDQFPTLPQELQSFYLAQGIVMGFIVKRMTPV